MDSPIKAWRRPTTVTCLRFDGMNNDAIRDFVGARNFKVIGRQTYIHVGKFDGQDPWHPLGVGDWVMAEPDGSGFYPCAGEVFRTLYSTEDPG